LRQVDAPSSPLFLSGFQEMGVGERTLLKMILRVHLEHVSYPHIARIIALLERYYTPAGIGVNNGGNGLAVFRSCSPWTSTKGWSWKAGSRDKTSAA